jgi:hypothetical protein
MWEFSTMPYLHKDHIELRTSESRVEDNTGLPRRGGELSQSRLPLEAHNKLPETPWMIETFQSNNKPCLQGAQLSFLQEGKILLANMKATIIPSKQQ